MLTHPPISTELACQRQADMHRAAEAGRQRKDARMTHVRVYSRHPGLRLRRPGALWRTYRRATACTQAGELADPAT